MSGARPVPPDARGAGSSRSLDREVLDCSSRSVFLQDRGAQPQPTKRQFNDLSSLIKQGIPDLGCASRGIPRFFLGRRKGVGCQFSGCLGLEVPSGRHS